MAKSKNRLPNEINASSMADIAFLLLIFFLVTTTIDVDKGILHKLPPWDPNQPPPEDLQLNKRNTLIVLINKDDILLVNGELTKPLELKEKAKAFVDNRGRRPDLSDSPEDAVISLQNDRGTSYDIYLQVQNELKAAYRELRDEFSIKKFGKKFGDLDIDKAKIVRDEYPMKISEADPKNIGEG